MIHAATVISMSLLRLSIPRNKQTNKELKRKPHNLTKILSVDEKH